MISSHCELFRARLLLSLSPRDLFLSRSRIVVITIVDLQSIRYMYNLILKKLGTINTQILDSNFRIHRKKQLLGALMRMQVCECAAKRAEISQIPYCFLYTLFNLCLPFSFAHLGLSLCWWFFVLNCVNSMNFTLCTLTHSHLFGNQWMNIGTKQFTLNTGRKFNENCAAALRARNGVLN